MVRAGAAFAAFATMIVAFLFYVANLGVRIAPPENRTNLTMDVADVNNLVVGSSVLLHGVPVGKVDRIDASVSNATIHFYVEDQYQVPEDSVVRLENLSALGEAYVELAPQESGGPVFVDGQRIAAESIEAPKSISELGATVVRTLRQLDPGELQNVVDQADAALPDPYVVLPNLERAGQVLHNTTTRLDGQGKRALDNLQSLLENAGFVGPAIAQAGPNFGATGPMIADMWTHGGIAFTLRNDMPGAVYVFGRFLQRIQQLLDDRGADLRVLMEPLTSNVYGVASALSNVDSSRVLDNLLAATPPDGDIELHVTMPPNGQPVPPLSAPVSHAGG